MKLSLCMIVKNEEEVLKQCLESVKGIVSEIVAVDTGSTDGTLDILKQYGAKIKQMSWTGDFSEARNASLGMATGTHILVLDADERVTSQATSFKQFINKYPQDAGKVLVQNDIDGEISVHPMVRLFPNDSRFRYEGVVHESICVNGQRDIGKPSDIVIYHMGYKKERYKHREKKKFYLDLYQKELDKTPDNGYLLYQIAKLHYSTEAYEEAAFYFEQCLSLQEREYLYFPVMLVMYGYNLKCLGRSTMAQDLLLEYMDQYQDFPDLFFLFGLLAMDTGVLANVELAFSECLRIGETKKYASIQGVGSYKAMHNLGVFYEVTGQLQKASEFYTVAASYGYDPAAQRAKYIKNKLNSYR